MVSIFILQPPFFYFPGTFFFSSILIMVILCCHCHYCLSYPNYQASWYSQVHPHLSLTTRRYSPILSWSMNTRSFHGWRGDWYVISSIVKVPERKSENSCPHSKDIYILRTHEFCLLFWKTVLVRGESCKVTKANDLLKYRLQFKWK